MRDFCFGEYRNLYQVWMYWLWTRLDQRRSAVVVCSVYECRSWQVCASFPRWPLKSVKSSQECVRGIPSSPAMSSSKKVPYSEWVFGAYTCTTARVFPLRLSVMSATLSLVGFQWKQAGALWVFVLPPVHEVLDREKNRKVVYLLFNGSVLLAFRFVDESGTMFIGYLMGWSTSWGCLSVSDVPICVVSVVVLEFSVEVGSEAWRYPINPTTIVGEFIALSMLLSVSFSGWCRSVYGC